jgi:hypothetical protein
MASGVLGLRFVGLIAVGLPPQQKTPADPLSWTEWVLVVAGLVISFYFSVRFVTWLHVKISSVGLFSELRRELELHERPPPEKS